ncbi:hypothetical protein NE237_032218 [Protea cynaroides]|uniref:Secreted protein n=1 Tax=Protea cynaroides TaxID=273540 RepID=A0A9Q0L3Z9_9MAGN|nr:hypothetical protein NE237_032218 [Protea cynaroides]
MLYIFLLLLIPTNQNYASFYEYKECFLIQIINRQQIPNQASNLSANHHSTLVKHHHSHKTKEKPKEPNFHCISHIRLKQLIIHHKLGNQINPSFGDNRKSKTNKKYFLATNSHK